jgi:hypothetical protein
MDQFCDRRFLQSKIEFPQRIPTSATQDEVPYKALAPKRYSHLKLTSMASMLTHAY